MPATLPDPEALASALQRHRVLGQLDAIAREALLARLQPRRFAAREIFCSDSMPCRRSHPAKYAHTRR